MKKKFKLNFKIIPIALATVLIILSAFIITTYQNQHLKIRNEQKKHLAVQKKADHVFNEKLVMLSNLVYYKARNGWVVNWAPHFTNWKDDRYIIPKQNDFVNILNKMFARNVGQIDEFNKQNAPFLRWIIRKKFLSDLDEAWNHWNDVISLDKMIRPGEKGYISLGEYAENDLKHFLATKLGELIKLINENNEENIKQLKGFIKNKKNAEAISDFFLSIYDNILNNQQIRNFWKGRPAKLIQEIDLNTIISLWKFWFTTLRPFYAASSQLRRNPTAKRQWLQVWFTKNLEANDQSSQNQVLLDLINDKTKSFDEIFEKFAFYGGENLVLSILEIAETIPDLNNIDWWEVLFKAIKEKHFKWVLQVVGAFYLQYLFDEIDGEKATFNPQAKLNDVISDFLAFVNNGLFAKQASKIRLLHSFQTEAVKTLFSQITFPPASAREQKLNHVLKVILREIFRTTLDDDATKNAKKLDDVVQALENIESKPKLRALLKLGFDDDVQPEEMLKFINDGKPTKFAQYFTWNRITTNLNDPNIIVWLDKQTANFRKTMVIKLREFTTSLAKVGKIFGNFDLNSLQHIFENSDTIQKLRDQFKDLKKAITETTKEASKPENKKAYIKSFVKTINKSSDLAEHLLSGNIINEQIDSNLSLLFLIILYFLQKEEPIWANKVSEVVKILFRNFKNNEVLDIINIFWSLAGDLIKVIDELAELRVGSIIDYRKDFYQKFFILIEKNKLLNKISIKLNEIRNKYEAQIIAFARESENFFAKKKQAWLNKFDPSNWNYDLKITEFSGDLDPNGTENQRVYTYKIRSKPHHSNEFNHAYEVVWLVTDRVKATLKRITILKPLAQDQPTNSKQVNGKSTKQN